MKFTKVILGLGVLATSLSSVGIANAATTLTGNMAADNAFYAFLGTDANALGTQVASGDNWRVASALTSTALTPGVTNFLNIEAINYGVYGGISFILNLTGTGFHFANGKQTISSDPADLGALTGSYNNSNNSIAEQPWVAATGAVTTDTAYSWGNTVGTSHWADAAINGLNSCQNCTVDFTVPILADAAVPESATWAMMLVGLGLIGFAIRRHQNVSLTYA